MSWGPPSKPRMRYDDPTASSLQKCTANWPYILPVPVSVPNRWKSRKHTNLGSAKRVKHTHQHHGPPQTTTVVGAGDAAAAAAPVNSGVASAPDVNSTVSAVLRRVDRNDAILNGLLGEMQEIREQTDTLLKLEGESDKSFAHLRNENELLHQCIDLISKECEDLRGELRGVREEHNQRVLRLEQNMQEQHRQVQSCKLELTSLYQSMSEQMDHLVRHATFEPASMVSNNQCSNCKCECQNKKG